MKAFKKNHEAVASAFKLIQSKYVKEPHFGQQEQNQQNRTQIATMTTLLNLHFTCNMQNFKLLFQ